MSDCEDFFLEYWMSPGKKKRKKNITENKMWVKHSNDTTIKKDQRIQKKKVKKKIKEAVDGRKEKKKKGKKKKKSSPEVNAMQGYSGASDPVAQPNAPDPHSTRQTEDSKKKTKRKKKVTFDVSPSYVGAKRPKVVSCSPKENVLPETVAATNTSCSQVTKTHASQAQSHDNDSQCTSDDINSQELFITQKTFRTVHSEPSSGEASDKEVDTPQPTKKKVVVQRSSVVKLQHGEGPDARLQDSHIHQHAAKEQDPLHRGKAAPTVLSQEEDSEQNPLKQMFRSNFPEERKVAAKHRVKNLYLGDPVVVKCSVDVTQSCVSRQESPSCLPHTLTGQGSSLARPTASISTQTENFFTAELSSYLSFRHKRGASLRLDKLKPLDLSVPQRAREDPKRRLPEVKVDKESPSTHKASASPDDAKEPGRHSCASSDEKGEETKPVVRQLWCGSTRHKSPTAPSPPSQSEPKSADTTSSEDNEQVCRTGKSELIQVRAVQMRLNESFFFKTKGDGQSPRPESPLMKLVQGREMKNRKCH